MKASRPNTPPNTPYANSSFATAPDVTEQNWSHIDLDEVKSRSEFLYSREGSAFSDDYAIPSEEKSESREKSEEPTSLEDEELQPELSWTMTLLLMTAVTVVSLIPNSLSIFAERITCSQMVSFNAEWLVESLDTIETTISKEWIALIMLPAISSIAGGCQQLSPFENAE